MRRDLRKQSDGCARGKRVAQPNACMVTSPVALLLGAVEALFLFERWSGEESQSAGGLFNVGGLRNDATTKSRETNSV